MLKMNNSSSEHESLGSAIWDLGLSGILVRSLGIFAFRWVQRFKAKGTRTYVESLAGSRLKACLAM